MQGGQTGGTWSISRKMYLGVALVLLAALVAATLSAHSAASGRSGLQRAIQVQERNSDRLLARGAVVGTGVGVDQSGDAVVVVLAKRRVRVAKALGGVAVKLKVTGRISSLRLAAPRKKPDNPGKGNGGGGGGGEKESSLSPTDVFPRPVPIGVSTGNAGECSAGTIGARVKDSSGVYALSNNHVYALSNEASIGSDVLQPGRYDTECSYSAGNVIGTLTAYEPIVFSTSTSTENVVDAAIASTGQLGNATPANGYGTPSSETESATLKLAVQKYGRTTSLTSGTVTAISAIIKVGYSAGTARFVDQVIVESKKPFIKAGDSGSLLVTKKGANPVGLLFAGNASGKYAIANPIGPVLAAFGVEIDGQ